MKAWAAIERLLIIWKSDLSNKINKDFFQVVVVSVLLYACTIWILTKQRKIWWELQKNATSYIEQILEATTPQNIICTATYLASQKPFKLNEQDMQDTAGEARMSL